MKKFSAMSAKDRRAVIWGLIVLVPSLGWIYVVRPFRTSLADTRDLIAVEREALARERGAILEAKRNPERQKQADSAMKAMTPRMFTGMNEVAAGAELVTYLGEVARKSRVWLADAATRPALVGADGVRTLRVELRAESDYEGILAFLQALERGDKLVRIERLDIARSARAGEEEIETLTVAAMVSGFAVGLEAPAAPSKTMAPEKAGGTP